MRNDTEVALIQFSQHLFEGYITLIVWRRKLVLERIAYMFGWVRKWWRPHQHSDFLESQNPFSFLYTIIYNQEKARSSGNEIQVQCLGGVKSGKRYWDWDWNWNWTCQIYNIQASALGGPWTAILYSGRTWFTLHGSGK